MASVGDVRAVSVGGGVQRAGNDDGGKEAAIEKATSIAADGLLIPASAGALRLLTLYHRILRGCARLSCEAAT